MLSDCHLHTCFSGDSETEVSLQIEQAIRLKMDHVCITDHHDYGCYSANGKQEFILDFDSYIPAIKKIREKYRDRIDVLTGMELGLQLHIASDLEKQMEKYGSEFDFIIGSSHFVDGLDVYLPEYFERSPYADPEKQEEERYRHYFETTLHRIVSMDYFDSFGHLDFVVRYGPHKNKYYSYEKFKDVIDAILEVLLRKDKALEVNTGGYRYGLGEPDPNEDIIRRYREMGGKLITVGSDAHVPGDVGCEFDRTAALLKRCGFREYTIYEKREPVFYPIP